MSDGSSIDIGGAMIAVTIGVTVRHSLCEAKNHITDGDRDAQRR